jgi:hypothetical protein
MPFSALPVMKKYIKAPGIPIMGKKLRITHWLLLKWEQPVFLWSFPGGLVFRLSGGGLFIPFCALLLFSRERM